MKLTGREPRHFLWQVSDRVGTVRLNQPDRKNPLTFDSYQGCATCSAIWPMPRMSTW